MVIRLLRLHKQNICCIHKFVLRLRDMTYDCKSLCDIIELPVKERGREKCSMTSIDQYIIIDYFKLLNIIFTLYIFFNTV